MGVHWNNNEINHLPALSQKVLSKVPIAIAKRTVSYLRFFHRINDINGNEWEWYIYLHLPWKVQVIVPIDWSFGVGGIFTKTRFGGCRLKEYLNNFWLIPLLSIKGLLGPAPGATYGSSSAVELKNLWVCHFKIPRSTQRSCSGIRRSPKMCQVYTNKPTFTIQFNQISRFEVD